MVDLRHCMTCVEYRLVSVTAFVLGCTPIMVGRDREGGYESTEHDFATWTPYDLDHYRASDSWELESKLRAGTH